MAWKHNMLTYFSLFLFFLSNILLHDEWNRWENVLLFLQEYANDVQNKPHPIISVDKILT